MPQKDPKAYRDYQRKYHLHHKRRNRVLAVEYKGGKCLHCGRRDDLEFHHRDPSTKTVEITKILSCSWARIKTEVDKCDLVCPTCHMIVDGRIDAEDYDDYKDSSPVSRQTDQITSQAHEQLHEQLPAWVTED